MLGTDNIESSEGDGNVMTKEEKRKEYQKEWMRRKRATNREKGICTVCTIRYADPGHTMCEECRQKQHEYSVTKRKQKMQEWKENGLCYVCGMPAAEGRTMCERHLEAKRGQNSKPERETKPMEPKKHKETIEETNEKARAMGLSYGKYQLLKSLGRI